MRMSGLLPVMRMPFCANWRSLRRPVNGLTILVSALLMMAGVGAVPARPPVKAPDEKTRKARDRFLVPVKVYRECYPSSGDNAARVNSLLATIPGRSPQSTYKSGICRLDDLRRGVLNANTNSASK